MIGIQLKPLDTWFFRGGTPFTMDGTPQENVGSLFPPHPPTIAGAVRAALALGNGWSGHGPWPGEIRDVLGDGPDDLGEISLDGPFLLRDGQPLFRIPRHVLGGSDGSRWTPRAFLLPGDPVACDLGDEVRLPELASPSPDSDPPKPSEGGWITREGIDAVVHGRLPHQDDLVPDHFLWSEETRIGLERDGATRTARDGMLYSTRHIRLRRGVGLGVRIRGLPGGWTPPFGRLLALGGESRLAECREWEWEGGDLFGEPPAETIAATGRTAVVALSPLDLPRDIHTGERPMAALGGARVVSACLDRPQRVGGWNSMERRPLPLRSVLPPGSTLFCEIANREGFAEAVSAGDGLARIGSRQESGLRAGDTRGLASTAGGESMKTAMLGLLAETPIHPGTGRGMGVVDLPVAREAATDYPVLVGSSLKGALRDRMETARVDNPGARFGRPEHAGDLLVSDARLLLLPVRSLTGSYRWATCPHLVERYRRDLARAGLQPRPQVAGRRMPVRASRRKWRSLPRGAPVRHPRPWPFGRPGDGH